MGTRWWLPGLLVLLLGGLAPAAAQDKPYVWKEGKCQLLFPGTPRQEKDALIWARIDGADLVALYMATFKPDPKVAKLSAEERKKFLASSRDLLVQAGGKLLASKDMQVEGFPAVDFQYESPDQKVSRMRLFLTDGGLYSLQVEATRDLVTGKEAEAFFGSFKLLK